MSSARFLIFSFSAGVLLTPAAGAEKTATESQQHRVLSPDGQQIGTRSLQITETSRGLEIAEDLEVTLKGKKISWKTAVHYSTGALASPREGTAETSIGGRVSMKGSVTFSERVYRYSGTAHLDRKGDPLPLPAKFGEGDRPLPAGTVIFQSAVSVLGPRLLPKDGELKGVVFVEFPDDLTPPELIKLKEGYRLVREKSTTGDGFTLKLFDKTSKEPVITLEFDGVGRLRSEVLEKLKFVRAGEKTSP